MISAASTLEEVGHVIRAIPIGGAAPDTSRPAIDRLIARGAVLFSPRTDTPSLIGDTRWTRSGALLLFAAFGERPEDVTTIWNADATRVTDEHIVWLQAGTPTLQLAAIERAPVADPGDYLIAWQLWQQVLPLKRAMIERCFDLIENQVAPERPE